MTSFVPAFPPRSLVLMPSTHVFSIARMIISLASCSPSQSSISHAVQKVPTGFASPIPVISKADPWMGSNIEGMVREGSMLHVGAIPIEPARAAARSERISACKLVARIVSRDSGLSVIRTVMASTSMWSMV